MDPARQHIIARLEQSIGLDIETVSSSTFERAIQHRMEALGVDDMNGYARTLAGSERELDRLIEEVVIPETWFFRHQEPFDLLVDLVRSAMTRDRSLPFRILSLPCSTGEEPYSAVMALLMAGIPPTCFEVTGIDISGRALEIANRGIYGDNSFRSTDLSFRDIFFQKSEAGYALKDQVRSRVRFCRGNILDTSFTDRLGVFRAIFCRNILIYLSRDAQEKVFTNLFHLLAPGGTVFTGHAEANLFLNTPFIHSPDMGSFAFFRPATNDLAQTGHRARPKHHTGSPAVPTNLPDWPRPQKRPAPAPNRAEDPYDRVLHLADTGRLTEAAIECEQHMAGPDEPSARWYYLLGVIRDSQGQMTEAVRLLRKALYLDPQHQESLVLLALLAEQSGDHDRARHYRRRARRIVERG